MDKKILAHFRAVDPRLASLAHQVGNVSLTKSDNPFLTLCESIIWQQLSDRVAEKMVTRFMELFPGKRVTAKKLLALPDAAVRSIGVSWSKVKFLKNLAGAVVNHQLNLTKLEKFADEEVLQQLIKFKGIGPWTAQMFLMFGLGRPDIFSFGDLGLRRAIQKLYQLRQEPTVKEAARIVSKWSPYRTWACLILWRISEVEK